MKTSPEKVDWMMAFSARRFDPKADLSNDDEAALGGWIDFAAHAAMVLDMDRPPLRIATLPPAVADVIRLKLALMLLSAFEAKDVGTINRIAERLKAIRREGMPEIEPSAAAFSDAITKSEKEGRPGDPFKADMTDSIGKYTSADELPQSKNGWWIWFKKRGLSWMNQRH